MTFHSVGSTAVDSGERVDRIQNAIVFGLSVPLCKLQAEIKSRVSMDVP